MVTGIKILIKDAQGVLKRAKKCLSQGKPVIAPTELLESLRRSYQELKTIDWADIETDCDDTRDWRLLCESITHELSHYSKAISWEQSSNQSHAVSFQQETLQQNMPCSIQGIVLGQLPQSNRAVERNYAFFSQQRCLQSIELGTYHSDGVLRHHRTQLRNHA